MRQRGRRGRTGQLEHGAELPAAVVEALIQGVMGHVVGQFERVGSAFGHTKLEHRAQLI